MTFVWVQTAADGSVYELSQCFTQSVQSNKPCKVREALIMSPSTMPRLILNFE